MFAYLESSIKNKGKVEMIYLSNSGEITQRIITIQEIGDKHIKAYCHLRKKNRIFKRDNILSIQPYKTRRKYIS